MKKIIAVMRKNMLIASAILMTGVLFTSCLKDKNDDNNTTVSGLMAVNLSPDETFAGFALSGSSITSSPLAFNSYTGGYLSVYPGSRQVESYNFGSGETLATDTYTFLPNEYYSVFLVGTDSNYENVIVHDAFDSLATTTQAFVRYVNAIPDVSNPTVTIAVNGTNVVNDNAPFKSVSDFVAVDAGDVTVNVTNGGTINVNRTITLEQQKVYTILLAGKPGTSGDAAVQIKYIQNGSVDADTGRTSSGSSRAAN